VFKLPDLFLKMRPFNRGRLLKRPQMKIPFKPDHMDGEEHVMSLVGLDTVELRFNGKSKNIVLVCKEVPIKKTAKKKDLKK